MMPQSCFRLYLTVPPWCWDQNDFMAWRNLKHTKISYSANQGCLENGLSILQLLLVTHAANLLADLVISTAQAVDRDTGW
ncbi:hypothetical protein PoB_004595200 [Plakobranchus ocellatus]|uniref:Uncharacterized protein n=1 Tax=Plakobranchus ocellatus TaxID=259542 RepID=A0AAV4BJC9_9GAST|nr:hypothetical protein PoB_004595200 [Plakobranchus ocellatus]